MVRVLFRILDKRNFNITLSLISFSGDYRNELTGTVYLHPDCIPVTLLNFQITIIMSHTILLIQPGTKPETRTYSDYESVNECMEGVCKIYEEHLKRQNPSIPSITYDISQLFDFIDQLSGGKSNWLKTVI